MPQFDYSTYSSQIFWLLLCLIAIYFSMAKVILPRIADIFEQRKENIDDNNSKATAINSDIAKIDGEIKKLLAIALDEYKLKIEASTKQINQHREDKANELKQQINQMNLESKNDIEKFLQSTKKDYDLAVADLTKIINNKIFIGN